MYALLEKCYIDHKKKGIPPMLPLWLCPTQVRLCPVNDSYLELCEELADEIGNARIRVDIDDRKESVSKKIRDAETEWVPFIVIIGEKEKQSGKLSVRIRKTGEIKEMTVEELIEMIRKETERFPFKPLPLPRLLSKRPVFLG
jgi:threonyl-tRNA synthetase